MKVKKGRFPDKRLAVLLLCVALLLSLCPMAVAAGDTKVDVYQQSDITTALNNAVAGDRLTLVLKNSIVLGGANSSKITIKENVGVTLVNEAGAEVVVTRYPLGDGENSRFNINGTLTINENTEGGGSLTFSGGADVSSTTSIGFAGNPQFAVDKVGSGLTINGGTFEQHCSLFGMIYSADGAVTTINDGTFKNNVNNWKSLEITQRRRSGRSYMGRKQQPHNKRRYV